MNGADNKSNEPMAANSLSMSSTVKFSDICTSVTCGVIDIVRHNSSTRCQYNPSVIMSCAVCVKNAFLTCTIAFPHVTCTVTNRKPLIEDKLIPYKAHLIPGCVMASLGYLHIHQAQSSGGSIIQGIFTPSGILRLFHFTSGLASAGTQLSVFHFNNAAFCIGVRQ